MDIRSWLASLGLDRFASTFEKNEIDLEVLATLTESDLEKMGIDALGARRKLITAIATLNAGGSSSSLSSTAPSSTSPQARRAEEARKAEAAKNAKPSWQQPWMSSCGQDQHGSWAATLVSGVEVKFRWCAAGKFTMGSPASEEGRSNGEVQHEVELTRGFWLAEAPVTQRLWQAVVGSNPSRFKGDDRPVETVSWDACQVFLQEANRMHGGLNVRLPTEAEWEYACRAGTTGPTWLGKNDVGVLPRIAWYNENSASETHPAKQKAANPWGLYDMLGNVWEWCSDWSGGYSSGRVVDPTGPQTGAGRVLRGGCWFGDAGNARAANRLAFEPGYRNGNLGFRLARGQ